MPPRLSGETFEQTISRSQPSSCHGVELALGALEDALAALVRHALEIAERLEGDDLEAEIAGHAPHVGRRAVERQQVVLEQLDALEACGGDRLELLVQHAAETDGSDRGLHVWFPKAQWQRRITGGGRQGEHILKFAIVR